MQTELSSTQGPRPSVTERSKKWISVWQYLRMLNDLHRQLKHRAGEFTGIYGLPRGGLIPATVLSHWLGLPLLVDINDITKRTLIVDDICETGKTLGVFIDNGFTCAVMMYNSTLGSLEGNLKFITAQEYNGISYVVFPYEHTDHICNS